MRYTEKLSHWPYWINEAVAHIAVKRVLANGKVAEAGDQSDNLRYVIESKHQTCFFHGLYCCMFLQIIYKKLQLLINLFCLVNSLGTFEFEKRGAGTLCRELVSYQCPPFMGSFCRTEVEFQRKAIIKNLGHHFATKKAL